MVDVVKKKLARTQCVRSKDVVRMKPELVSF